MNHECSTDPVAQHIGIGRNADKLAAWWASKWLGMRGARSFILLSQTPVSLRVLHDLQTCVRRPRGGGGIPVMLRRLSSQSIRLSTEIKTAILGAQLLIQAPSAGIAPLIHSQNLFRWLQGLDRWRPAQKRTPLGHLRCLPTGRG